jgi:hypothetical protein
MNKMNSQSTMPSTVAYTAPTAPASFPDKTMNLRSFFIALATIFERRQGMLGLLTLV